ncbi:hypothetical protein [Paenibacillus protaetiae]|nr:hypothetical protein [Paenibacillus protaetiae]
MPLLLLVMVFFIVLIRVCAVQLGVQSAASQTARQIAAYIHPADLAFQQISGKLPSGIGSTALPDGKLSGWSSIAGQAAEWLPDPAGTIASAVVQGDWSPVEDLAATELGRTIVEPLLRKYANSTVLDPARMKLYRLTLPDLKNKQQPYVSITAEYVLPFRFPFMNTPLIFREQAAERVWVSDALPAKRVDPADGEAVPIRIISIQPSPVYPGQRATVVALTNPGASASLTVTYKSGNSIAKHLGQAAADHDGYVSWTWLVGGNTTAGVWEMTAESASGIEASMNFVVDKKKND